ncbi:unnamed protein product [Brachionus calyciflorus]|uniref:C2H2-type domain-containing protein n=1 Tax=Brachionus calyciflorus TaxID=104777 RepID=A0A814NXK1_9BILA|nr:unnamed protein product [Brachionus calyciflorus]
MNFTEFYLTEGFISQIREKVSLFRESSQTDKSTENIVFRLSNQRPILKVLEIAIFEPTESNSSLKRFGILLSDGIEEVTVTIDESLKNLFDRNDKERFLQEGSVIMLNEFRILSIRDILNNEEYEQEKEKDKRIISLVDMTLLGILSLSDIKRGNQYAQSNKANHKKPSHSISKLNLSLSRSAWSIKAKLVSKSLIREFENRSNGSKGMFQRFLFLDNSGQIEAVCFNDLCKEKSIECLNLNKTYLIENGEIKKARPNIKAWPKSLTVDYDIMLTNATIISESDELEINLEQQVLLNNQNNENENISVSISRLHEKFTSLSKLLTMKSESIVDVIGIITEYFGLVRHFNEKHSNVLPNNGKVFASNTEQRRFSCEICDESFNRNEHLNRHFQSQKHKQKCENSSLIENESVVSKSLSNKRKNIEDNDDSVYDNYDIIEQDSLKRLKTEVINKELQTENVSILEYNLEDKDIGTFERSVQTNYIEKKDVSIQVNENDIIKNDSKNIKYNDSNQEDDISNEDLLNFLELIESSSSRLF